jgi:hypothetical protein
MAGRRAVETSYSTLKMYAMMKLRLTEFYKDPFLGAGLAAMAIGARDAKYAPYREARLPATKYAKAADLYGSFTGQVQAAIMNIKKLGIDQAGSKLEDKCKAIYAYVDTHGLESVKIDNLTAGDAVLVYFGCIELPKPSTEAAEEAAVSEVVSEIEKALEAKRTGARTGATAGPGAGPSAQQQAVETNVEEVEKNAEKAAEQTIQQSSGQAAQQTG